MQIVPISHSCTAGLAQGLPGSRIINGLCSYSLGSRGTDLAPKSNVPHRIFHFCIVNSFFKYVIYRVDWPSLALLFKLVF